MSQQANEAGFTLIELLVVLSVMALLALLLIPKMGARPKLAQGSNETALRSAITTAQRAAATQGEVQSLPDTLLERSQWHPDFPQGSAAPAFFADGSANGGTLTLGNGNRLHIAWIDGHAQQTR